MSLDYFNAHENHIIQISSGSYSCGALTRDGEVFSWGFNHDGQLGDGTNQNRNVPTKVQGLPRNIVQIAYGYMHSMALTKDGKVYAWGNNYYGQLGNGTNQDSKVPVEVRNLPRNIIQICTGSDVSMALNDDGKVYVWGINDLGILGETVKNNKALPILFTELPDNIVQITCHYTHAMALAKDGKVYSWGRNYDGQLGHDVGDNHVRDLDNIVQISCGFYHSMALKDDGKVYAWGANHRGLLGDGTEQQRESPVPILDLPENITHISASAKHSMALAEDGVVFAWGRNVYGELGDGTNQRRNVPVHVEGLPGNMVDINSGLDHSIVLTNDGIIYAWGRNNYGQLGIGTNVDSRVPVVVGPFPQ